MSRLIIEYSEPPTDPVVTWQLDERKIEDSAIPSSERQIESAEISEVVDQGACVDPKVLDPGCLLNLSEVLDPIDLEAQEPMQRLRWARRNCSFFAAPGSMVRVNAISDRIWTGWALASDGSRAGTS